MPRRLLSPQRLSWMLGFVSLAGLALAVRVAYIQCVGRGDYIKAAIEKPGTKLSARGTRGSIIDRSGRALVVTATTVTVACSPPTVQKWAVAPTGRKVKDLTRAEVRALPRITELARTITTYIPQAAETDILERLTRKTSYAVLARYAEADHAKRLRDRLGRTPGLAFTSSERRAYMNDTLASGVLGYCNTAQQPSEGLELWYRQITEPQTTPPDELYDRAGRRILGSTSARRPRPLPGKDLVLTLDYGTQQAAEQILDRCWATRSPKGANVIVLSPRDGAILAMVSVPSFDPNLFNGGISQRDWEKLANDPRYPMENRAISGQYPPGSTYKVVTAAAALAEGLVTPATRFYCNGSFTLGNRSYRCWQRHGHGWVDLHRALVSSCDVYFYNLGKMLGVDKIAEYARSFGFGERTGVDLPREKPGLAPTKAWKLKRFKEPWQLGENIPIAIGQGFDLVTPLQLANAYAALANGGTVWRPRIVKQIEEADGRILKYFPPEKAGALSLSAQHLELIRRGLWGVVNEPGGTGGALRRPEGDVAGKTGTSQVVGLSQDDRVRRARIASGRYRDHALFACFAPYRNPEIAVAVIAEHSGHGGSAAAPVARKVIDAYFQLKKERAQPKAAPVVQDGAARPQLPARQDSAAIKEAAAPEDAEDADDE